GPMPCSPRRTGSTRWCSVPPASGSSTTRGSAAAGCSHPGRRVPDGPVVVVVNPTAGGGKAGRLIGRVDGLLRDAGVEHRVELSASAEDLTERARRAGEEGASV